MTLHYVSLFSGIEAFSVAASRIKDVDWRPVFFSEIDSFASAVLQHHFPSVPNLGDVCQIRVDPETNTVYNDDTTIPLPGTGIDILAGGSPCQDVSVAGKRAGMSPGGATRSSLAFEYARLVRELHPRLILWENVPGVRSSNGGRDFGAFLRSLDELGYSLAWRSLDVQYATVDSFSRATPQRRDRVWLVGCLGGDGRIHAEILFEPAGLLGDTPPSREAGQGFAAPAGYGPPRNDRVVGEARAVGNGQLNQTEPEEVAKTLDTMHDAQVVCIGKEAYNIGKAGQGSLNIAEDGSAQTVRADSHPSAVATCLDMTHADEVVREVEGGAAPTLQSRMGTGGNQVPLVQVEPDAVKATRYIVRRLTPGECETLQAFPQRWTRIPYRGKPAEQCPDSPRYKALGNSWGTNCAEWILRRVVAAFRLGHID